MRLRPEDTFVPKTLSPCLGSRFLVHVRKVCWLMGLLFVVNLHSCRRSRSKSWRWLPRADTRMPGRDITAVPGHREPARGDPARRQQSWQVSIHISWLCGQCSPGSLVTKGLPELFIWFNKWSFGFRLSDSTQLPPITYNFFFFSTFDSLAQWNLTFSLLFCSAICWILDDWPFLEEYIGVHFPNSNT